MVMKFLIKVDIIELKSDSRESQYCYLMSILMSKKAKSKLSLMDPQDFGKPLSHLESVKQLIEALLDKAQLD